MHLPFALIDIQSLHFVWPVTMFFITFIYIIGLLLGIQGVKSTVIIDQTSCAPYQVTVRTSVDEMVDMVGAAYTRTQNTYNSQASQEEMRVVFNTFNAYFPTNNPQTTTGDLLCISLSSPTNICIAD